MSSVGAAQPRSESLRLTVQPERSRAVAGTTIQVSIGLRDAHNQLAPAPSAFVITLATTPPVAGAVSAVTIPAGQSAATLQLTPSAPGILQIRAMHPQAFEGGAFVRVVRPGRAAPEATKPPIPSAGGRAGGSGSTTTGSASGGGSLSAPPNLRRPRSPASQPGEGGAFLRRPERSTPAPPAPDTQSAPGDVPAAAPAPATEAADGQAAAGGPAPATGPAVGDASTPAPRLELQYSPQRKLLADGQDAATIQAFLLDGAVPGTGLKVTLHASSGALMPQSLVVQGDEGHSTLTSDRPGDVEVRFMSSEPHAEIKGEQRLHIHFGPPIHGLRLEAKPAAISLVDQTDLVVTLIDTDGRAVATDEPRAVLLALDNGRGEIARKELIVKPGEFEARTLFAAASAGQVEISVASNSLRNQTARIDVRLPLGLLALSVIGGLVGGLLAFLHRRKARWTRVAVGGITGFLLYWAFIFGLMRVMPRAFVINPLSNFALSTIGGWLGTEVFALLLPRLGLNKPRGREHHGGGKREPHESGRA